MSHEHDLKVPHALPPKPKAAPLIPGRGYGCTEGNRRSCYRMRPDSRTGTLNGPAPRNGRQTGASLGSSHASFARPHRRSFTPFRSHDVALLCSEALERLRPSMTLWIDALRAMLSERGCRLHVFHGPQYFRSNPGATLEKLVSQHPHGCWILVLSNETTQRWFERNAVPCVVAGSVYEGIALPFRDLDTAPCAGMRLAC